MYNEIEILKNASLTLDNNDIVKSAGFVQNISNFLKRLVSPEYRDKVDDLTNKFDDVRSLLSDLNTATQNVQEAIQNADVSTYEQNLSEVRILIKHLSERLGQMEESAEQASVVPHEQPKSIKHEQESKKQEEISGILEGYKQRHPVGYDMPISDNINKPYQDFDHLKRAKIIISDKSKEFNLRRYFANEFRKAKFPIEVFGDSRKIDALFNALINGIRDGIVISNKYAIESKVPPLDPAEGLTRIIVETSNVDVPELNLSFKAEVILNDFGAQIRPRAELSIFRTPRIWDVKYSGEAPSIIPKTKSGKKALFLIVPEYSQNENSKKDIVKVKEELKKKHNVEEVIDATADKIEALTKHFVGEGYDIIGVEQYRPKMSARINAIKKIAWWDPDKIKAPTDKIKTSPVISVDPNGQHKWAREILERAFEKVMGRKPALQEIQLAQTTALMETTYGTGWKGEGKNSNNWGAIQCADCPNKGKPVNGKCPTGSFLQQDSSPTPSGKQKVYHWCYKSYPTPEAGAADLIKQIFVNKRRKDLTLDAAENRSIKDFSTAMYDSKYYEGTGKNREENINDHIYKMNKGLAAITVALNERAQFSDYKNNSNTGFAIGSYQSPIKSDWRTSGVFDPVSVRPNGSKGHFGVDMRAPEGTSIYPFLPGMVTNVGTDPKGGNVINIEHDNGFRTYYAHLSGFNVNKGDKVDNNTVIGNVGKTGNAMHTFPHLHFQVWKNNQIQDPASFFTVPPYTDTSTDERKQMIAKKTEEPKKQEDSSIENFERMLWTSANGSQLNHVVKNAIARKLLPKSNVLVIAKDAGDDYVNMLCKSLHKLFGAEISTRKNGNKTEINCIVAGNEKIATDAVKAVCDCVSEGYQIINKQLVKTSVYSLIQMRK
jgi:murein DD-endopeptidase MepM/ murein hydrolase activator NlpD